MVPTTVAGSLPKPTWLAEPERMVACTICGLASLPVPVAEGKLQALGAGAALLRKELGSR